MPIELPPNPTNEQWEEFQRKGLFVMNAMPSDWLGYAHELEEAAEALWLNRENTMSLELWTKVIDSKQSETSEQNFGHARTYILLAGLALENVIKAILVMNNPALINEGILSKSLKSHKLLNLANQVKDLELTAKEKKILQICQDAIPYYGRYPVPLDYNGIQPKEAATSSFREEFRKLHFRLCKSVYDAIKDGWDSGVKSHSMAIKLVRNKRYDSSVNIKETVPRTKKKKK
jgi:hypothetical protein